VGLLASSAALWAQTPKAATPPPLTFKSLGQPPLFKPYVAGSLTWNREGEDGLGGVGVAGLLPARWPLRDRRQLPHRVATTISKVL
jgi:hypothetical protein